MEENNISSVQLDERGFPTKAWCEEMYTARNLTIREIAKKCQRSPTFVWHRLQEYAIPLRPNARRPNVWKNINRIVERSVLYQMHVVDGMTAVKIAEVLDCHHSTISRLIRDYDLDAGRPLVNLPRVPQVHKEMLEHWYLVETKSCREIAERYNVSTATVTRWLHQFDIPVRTGKRKGRPPESYTRKLVPTTRFGAEFSAQEKNLILQRDGNACQMPNCGKIEFCNMHVHHILPVYKGGTHDLDNGITLCADCHMRIKYKELQFVELFRSIVNKHTAP